jgi:DNA invertase Pin-like site-specific DNA recombinase
MLRKIRAGDTPMDDQPRLRAFTYARRSKDHDAGIGRQQQDTDQLADRRGYVIPDDGRFADNDVSASKLTRKRPGYERMMARIRNGECDVLVITYMDRLYRQPIELENIIPVIEKAGVLVATVYEGDMDLRTDTGQLQARVKVAFARAEVMRKANRQKRANLERAQKGDRTPHGIRPFGYQDDRITPREDEAEAIRWACRHVLAGGSVSAILREWTKMGVKPRFEGRTRRDEGGQEVPFTGRWTHASVSRILTNPRIAGLNTLPNSDDIIGEGKWSPIITPETWAAVKEILRDPKRAAPRGSVSLGGFLFYCRCGAKVQRDMRYRGRKGDPGRVGIPIYKCLEFTAKAEGRAGPHVTMAATQIDAYIEMRILDRMREPGAAAMFERRGETADVPKLKAERKEVSDGLARMAGDEALGILPRSIYLDAAKRVTARLEEIDALIAEAGKMDAAALLLGADDPADVWDGLDITVQRKIVESLVHVTIKPPGCGCRNPDLTQLVRVAWRKG